jgi:hypothetical protein
MLCVCTNSLAKRQKESEQISGAERIASLTSETRRLQELAAKSQQALSACTDELTQTKAHLELYRLQLEEEAAERDVLKVQHDCSLPRPAS